MPENSGSYDLSFVADSPRDAWRYLLNARRFVSNQTPPADYGYRQMSHASDTVPVFNDPSRPAILNASYKHFGQHFLSISVPSFIEQDDTLQEGPKGVEIRPGFSNLNLQLNFSEFLRSHRIQLRTGRGKIGHDGVSRTYYFEIPVGYKDFKKGNWLIAEYVHNSVEAYPAGRPAWPYRAASVMRKMMPKIGA